MNSVIGFSGIPPNCQALEYIPPAELRCEGPSCRSDVCDPVCEVPLVGIWPNCREVELSNLVEALPTQCPPGNVILILMCTD